MENSSIVDGNCWVAVFDILGFCNMVGSFPRGYVIEKYQEALKESNKHSTLCRFKFFSDTFIFYTDNDSQNAFNGIAAASELFFQEMFRKKIPLRGCLTVGHFYADEENGMFFGPALIDAYQLAEGQNWIGFVLSKKARAKCENAITNGPRRYNYLDYPVPYKKKPKRRNLLVYYPNICITESYRDASQGVQGELLEALEIMKYAGKPKHSHKSDICIRIADCLKYRGIVAKYRNTERFLSYAYPILRKRFEQKYPEPRNS